VISAGFGEIGTNEGHAMEKSLVETAKKYKMKLIGPNCLGVMRPSAGINVSFAENLEKSGSIALLSQSGALAVALLDAAQQTGLTFSLMVSMGNKAARMPPTGPPKRKPPANRTDFESSWKVEAKVLTAPVIAVKMLPNADTAEPAPPAIDELMPLVTAVPAACPAVVAAAVALCVALFTKPPTAAPT
jgi:hypothetical protein